MIISFCVNIAGGQCTTDRHCSTKTLSVRGDTEPDQLCVPAIFHCDGTGLSQVPQHHDFISSRLLYQNLRMP